MRKTFAILALAATLTATAEERVTRATLYREFKPAEIYLNDGRKIKQSLANVGLKNSALLYPSGTFTMEANMANIRRVEFDDRQFEVVENQLAVVVDSLRGNIVYRVDYLDMEAYEARLRNNVNISNLSLGDQISTTTVDLNNEEDHKFPLVHKYYMFYGGELFRVHEREISRRLPKDKELKRMYKTVISQDDFSWTSDESVSKLLRALTP